MTLKTAIDNKPKGTKFIFNCPIFNYEVSAEDPVGNRIMYTTLDKCIMTIIDNTYNSRLPFCIWHARGTNKPSFASVDTSTGKVKVRYEEAK